jgi:hypothetical protein
MRRFAATLAHVLVLIRSTAATADRVHNPPYRPRLGASKSSNEITRIGSLLLIRPLCDCRLSCHIDPAQPPPRCTLVRPAESLGPL